MVKTAAVIVAGMLCGMLQDMVDNPEYKHWSKFKPGTSVTLKTDMDMGTMKMESRMTTKLASCDKDKAVLEMVSVSVMMGKETETKLPNRDVPAKVKKGEPGKETAKPKEGDEEVEVCGKKYKCHWIETTTEANGMKTTAKVWTNDDIPGTLAKMESHSEGNNMKTTSKSQVTEIKQP